MLRMRPKTKSRRGRKLAKDDLIVGWTTVGSPEDAERLAKGLVRSKLAACVQVDEGVRSFYQWKGELCSESEVRLWVKTIRSKLAGVEFFWKKEHPYETPQWCWLPIGGVGEEYGQWFRKALE